MAFPTVFIGLGRFGQEVVDRARMSLSPDDHATCLTIGCEPAEVGARLKPLLEGLLRAGRTAGERASPRLDLVFFAAALQLDDSGLLVACLAHSRWRRSCREVVANVELAMSNLRRRIGATCAHMFCR